MRSALIAAVIVAAAMWAAWRLHLSAPRAAPDAYSLLDDGGRGERRIQSAMERWRVAPTEEQVAERWASLRETMLRDGATAEEAQGVTDAARQAVSRRLPGRNSAYAVPVYAERALAAGQKVWVLGLGWGVRRMAPGRDERPGHVCRLVIDATTPYKVLAGRSCA